MKVAIQQPHYFPWVGYFDKMAKVDAFILMDTVQLEKRSPMTRNRVIAPNGDIKYLTISANQHGHREKAYREIPVSVDPGWKTDNLALIREFYRKAPFFSEIMPLVSKYYENNYPMLCDWTIASIQLVRDLLEIPTRLFLQSSLPYNQEDKKSDLILSLCLIVKADVYMAGRGASMAYLDQTSFKEHGVKIVFQDFQHPVYPQRNTAEFVPGISILDMFFNCGVEETCRIFWENVNSSHELDKMHGDMEFGLHPNSVGGSPPREDL